MKHIFYLIGVYFIIYEIMWLLSPVEHTKKTKEYLSLSKENKNKKWDDMDGNYKSLLLSKGIPSLIIIIWMVIGLMTFNWFVFLVMLSINLIIISPLSKITKYGVSYTILHWFNSLIGLCFGVFVILNSYHLKINAYEWIINWLNIQ